MEHTSQDECASRPASINFITNIIYFLFLPQQEKWAIALRMQSKTLPKIMPFHGDILLADPCLRIHETSKTEADEPIKKINVEVHKQCHYVFQAAQATARLLKNPMIVFLVYNEFRRKVVKYISSAEGQLISNVLLVSKLLPKKQQKKFQDFCPGLKKEVKSKKQCKRVKMKSSNQCSGVKCPYFFDLTSFQRLGQKSWKKICWFFWKKF